jgi:hypothetical protein
VWEMQVKALMGRLASEKSALRATATAFHDNDTAVGSQFHLPSMIEQY